MSGLINVDLTEDVRSEVDQAIFQKEIGRCGIGAAPVPFLSGSAQVQTAAACDFAVPKTIFPLKPRLQRLPKFQLSVETEQWANIAPLLNDVLCVLRFFI